MAVTNWLSPSSTTNTVAGWTSIGNVFAQDGANATVTVSGVGTESPYFRISGFNDGGTALATLVASATSIDGFEFQFYGRTASAPQYSYMFIGNAPSGSPQNLNGQEKTILMPVSATTSAFGGVMGGPTDLLGGKQGGGSWVKADLDANFGVSGAWASNAATMAITWDTVQMRIYYSAAGGGAGGKWWWGN